MCKHFSLLSTFLSKGFQSHHFSFYFIEQYISPELSPFNKYLFESKWDFGYSVKKSILFYVHNSHLFQAVRTMTRWEEQRLLHECESIKYK